MRIIIYIATISLLTYGLYACFIKNAAWAGTLCIALSAHIIMTLDKIDIERKAIEKDKQDK